MNRLASLLLAAVFSWHTMATTQPTLIVGAQNINYFPHYDFLGVADKGYAWALLEAFAAEYGYRFEYRALPIKRLERELQKGTVDFAYPDNPKWSHRKDSRKVYSAPLVTVLGGTMVRKDNLGAGIDAFTSLSVPFGFTPVMWQKLVHDNKVRLVQVADSSAALEMVLKGRASGADIEYNVASHILTQQKKTGDIVLDPSLPYDIVTFNLATIKHAELLRKLDEFVHDERQTIRRLQMKYGLEDPATILKRYERLSRQQPDKD